VTALCHRRWLCVGRFRRPGRNGAGLGRDDLMTACGGAGVVTRPRMTPTRRCSKPSPSPRSSLLAFWGSRSARRCDSPQTNLRATTVVVARNLEHHGPLQRPYFQRTASQLQAPSSASMLGAEAYGLEGQRSETSFRTCSISTWSWRSGSCRGEGVAAWAASLTQPAASPSNLLPEQGFSAEWCF